MTPTERVRELLADGKWHDRREVVADVAKTMAPGPAYRRAEVQRVGELERHGRSTQTARQGTDTDAVAAGQRRGARYIVEGLERRGTVEKRILRDGARQIRLAKRRR